MSRIYQVNKPSTTPAVVAPQTNTSSPITKQATLTSSSSISQTNLSTRNPNIYTNNKSEPSTTAPNNNNNSNFNSIVPTSPENSEMSQDFTRLLNRLENITSRLESYAQSTENRQVNGVKSVSVNGASPSSESFDNLPSIAAFDDLYNATFSSFKSLSTEIGNDVVTIVDLVDKVFKYERSFLVEASRSSQPAQDELMKFYKDFSKCIEDVQSFREKNRQSQLFNHLSAISESIGAFGWISVQPAPSPYVKEMSDAAQFYTNRVLKDYKEKDVKHVNWVKLWLQFLSELQAYVKQFHTTGVVWNSAKKSEKFNLSRISISGSSVSAAKSAPASSGAPPPPPPPMPNFNDLFQDKKPTTETITAALFAEINKGSDITKGLRQVSDAQKTHKNPNLRGASTVPGGVSSTGSSFTKAAPVNKPPVLELVDKKWKVEYQSNRNDLVIDQTDLKHTIYIFQCKECTITVKGKVNSILIDSCSRVALLFDDVLSTIEFINSKNVQMQVLGRVPTVIIEKTDGCQVYLSKNSLDTEVVSSKSSAMNVLLPNEKGDDFNEYPIPEQYKTIIDPKTKKLVTSPTELV